VGSPIVSKPDVLVAMNLPSLDRYEPDCASGAIVVCDSSMIPRKLERTDLSGFYVPASIIAEEQGLKGLANMILAGKAMKEAKLALRDEFGAALAKTVPPKKASLLEANKRALELGFDYGESAS
jgi:2-oxoglutarate ferredoxin oxidoreductase subunit gamma